MLTLYLMLFHAYYAQNYASLVGSSLALSIICSVILSIMYVYSEPLVVTDIRCFFR